MVPIALLEKKKLKKSMYASALRQIKTINLVVEAKKVDTLIEALRVTPVSMVLYCWDPIVDKDTKPLAQLQKAHPQVKVLVLFTRFSFELVFQLLQFKNFGYIEENAKPKQLEKAIKQLLKKGYYYEPNMVTQKRIATHQAATKEKEERKEFAFTPKQKEIIRDLLAHKTTKQICDTHCIEVSTLRKHYRNILQITETKTMKDALIEILRNVSNSIKLWGIQCLVILCTLCNNIYLDDDNFFENIEGKKSFNLAA